MEKVKLNTRFGEIEVDPAKVITFPQGIPGFESSKRWTFFHEVDDEGEPVNGVVVHLQSIDDGKLSLPLAEPSMFGFDYQMVLTDEEVAELKIENTNDILVLTTLSKNNLAANQSSADIHANISAPILINVKSRIGMQKVLSGSKQSKVTFSTTFAM